MNDWVIWSGCGIRNDAAIQERNWPSVDISVTVPLKVTLEIPETSSSMGHNVPFKLLIGC